MKYFFPGSGEKLNLFSDVEDEWHASMHNIIAINKKYFIMDKKVNF